MTVDHRVVEDALASADVTVDHVDSVAGSPVDDFSIAASTWAVLAGDRAANRSFMEQHERRGLYLAPSFDGVVAVDGLLDSVAGVTVITALEHVVPPDPTDTPDGPRSPAQRRADALLEPAESYLSGSDRNAASVTVNAVADVATLTGKTTGGLGTERCDVDRFGPVALSSMARLGCGAEFTRVVMDGPSVVLDLGRSRRLASAGQRQALAVGIGVVCSRRVAVPPGGVISITSLGGCEGD